MWNENIELPDGLYYVLDIQDYYEYVIKKHDTVAANIPIRIYVNKTKINITFRIKTGYYPEHLMPEIMKLYEATKNKITKGGNGKNVPRLEITEAVLIHINIANNVYQHGLRVLYTFVWSIIRYFNHFCIRLNFLNIMLEIRLKFS